MSSVEVEHMRSSPLPQPVGNHRGPNLRSSRPTDFPNAQSACMDEPSTRKIADDAADLFFNDDISALIGSPCLSTVGADRRSDTFPERTARKAVPSSGKFPKVRSIGSSVPTNAGALRNRVQRENNQRVNEASVRWPSAAARSYTATAII